MKTLVTLTALLIFGWLAVVTFYGPELARAINGPEPVKAKVHRHREAPAHDYRHRPPTCNGLS